MAFFAAARACFTPFATASVMSFRSWAGVRVIAAAVVSTFEAICGTGVGIGSGVAVTTGSGVGATGVGACGAVGAGSAGGATGAATTGGTTAATTTGGAGATGTATTGGGGGGGNGGVPIVGASATSPTPGPVNFTAPSFGFVTTNVSAHLSPVTVQPSCSMAKSGATWSGWVDCQTRLQCAVRFVRESSVAWKSAAHSLRYVLIPKPETLQTVSQVWVGVSHWVASPTLYPSTRRSFSVEAPAVPVRSRLAKSAARIATKVRLDIPDLSLGGLVTLPAVDAAREHLIGARPYMRAAAVCK